MKLDPDEVMANIASAVRAERERCAGVVEKEARAMEIDRHFDAASRLRACAEEIRSYPGEPDARDEAALADVVLSAWRPHLG